MSKNIKDKILNLAERISKRINNLGYARPVDACDIVEMLDKLEDCLMDYKAYSTKFKEDIRHLRYLAWSIAAARADMQRYYKRDVIECAHTLKDELYEWTSKELEVIDE